MDESKIKNRSTQYIQLAECFEFKCFLKTKFDPAGISLINLPCLDPTFTCAKISTVAMQITQAGIKYPTTLRKIIETAAAMSPILFARLPEKCSLKYFGECLCT